MIEGIGGDYPYAEGTGVLPALIGGGSALYGLNEALIFSGGFASTPITAQFDVLVFISSSGQVIPVLTVTQLYDGEVSSQASGATAVDTTLLLQALMQSVASSSSLGDLLSQPHEVWVMNTTTGGSTRYESYDFTSFALVNGHYFGVREDGVYALDAKQAIAAHLHLGKFTFSSLSKKRVESCYMGVSSTGRLYLRVTVEGNSYTYAARSFDEQAKTQRVDLGKGLKSVYYEFELYNSDGCDFDLSTVQFNVVELSRRI